MFENYVNSQDKASRLADCLDEVEASLGNDLRLGERGIHLAVFSEPFLTFLMLGRKTVDSRFSIHPIAPYLQVFSGDLILIKRSGGPIVAAAIAGTVTFHTVTPKVLKGVQLEYAGPLCATDEFWNSKKRARYLTLIELAKVFKLSDIVANKRDRRGWVVLRSAQ